MYRVNLLCFNIQQEWLVCSFYLEYLLFIGSYGFLGFVQGFLEFFEIYFWVNVYFELVIMERVIWIIFFYLI